MKNLIVAFDIPEIIRRGLETGKLIRRGGVIQHQDGKIAMWLREGPGMAHLSRSGTIPPQLASQLQFLQLGTNAILGMQVLSLGGMVAGFAMLNSKLGRIEQKLEQVLGELSEIKEQLNWLNKRKDAKIFAQLRTALNQAQWLEDTGRQNELIALRFNFVGVEEHCTQLLVEMLKARQAQSKAELFLQYFLLLCLATVSRVRLEIMLEGTTAGIASLDKARQHIGDLAQRFHHPLTNLKSNPHLLTISPSLKAKIIQVSGSINEARGRLYSYRTEMEWCKTNNIDLNDWENLRAPDQENAALIFIRPMKPSPA